MAPKNPGTIKTEIAKVGCPIEADIAGEILKTSAIAIAADGIAFTPTLRRIDMCAVCAHGNHRELRIEGGTAYVRCQKFGASFLEP